jgi:hypothetical protein
MRIDYSLRTEGPDLAVGGQKMDVQMESCTTEIHSSLSTFLASLRSTPPVELHMENRCNDQTLQ